MLTCAVCLVKVPGFGGQTLSTGHHPLSHMSDGDCEVVVGVDGVTRMMSGSDLLFMEERKRAMAREDGLGSGKLGAAVGLLPGYWLSPLPCTTPNKG